MSENEAPGESIQQGRRKRQSLEPESDADSYAGSDTGGRRDTDNVQQLAKKLVRYALACEYARQPIKRQDISTKVLGSASRRFKDVFAEANLTLRQTFGMEMIELPMREKVTIREKRAAQKSDKAPTSSKSWILVSSLDRKYRAAASIMPSQSASAETESAYVGLYSMIVSVIMLAGGTLPEAKLERYLRRMNAERSTPVDTTDKLLARMQREGYIVKLRDNSSGEEVVDYMVGPRGRVEIGQDGVADLVQKMYGTEAPEDLDKRLARSLGLSERKTGAPPTRNGVNSDDRDGTSRRQRGRPKRTGGPAHDEDDDEEEDSDEGSSEDDEED